MEALKTLVGKCLENVSTENVAFNIAECLGMTEEERRKCARRVGYYETMQAYDLKKGWRVHFDRVKNNLKFDDEGVCNCGTQVAKLDWIKRTAKRRGRWPLTFAKHQHYAMKELVGE